MMKRNLGAASPKTFIGSPSKKLCNSPEVANLGRSSPRNLGSPFKKLLDSSEVEKLERASPKKTSSHFKNLLDAETPRVSPRKIGSPFKKLYDSTETEKLDRATPKKKGSPLKHLSNSSDDANIRKSSAKKAGSLLKKLCDSSKANLESSNGLVDAVEEVQKVLRLRISQSQKPPVISGYEKERSQLHDLIHRTVISGESNSLLVIGPRGCGKSMLISNVVEGLLKEKSVRTNLLQVQLNGLLQTDDKVALREITRQLKLENTVGDKVFGSFAETLQFLLAALKTGDQASKPILFVLEEFDLFAQHKNQTLLYNLFDVSQSAQTPICVIGITCRLDVVELLEKRVKSRFSHRQLHLFNKLNLQQYRKLAWSYLHLDEHFPNQEFALQWNQNIRNLLEEVSVKDILERQFSLSNDVRGLISLLTYPVCQLTARHPTITASDVITSFKLLSTDSKTAMLHGVSILELCLIISMKHLMEIYEGEPFNFEMVYSEYLKFARRRSGVQMYEKPVVMKAYEHLQTLEFIRSQGSGHAQKEYKLMTLLVHPSQVLDAVERYPGCPTEIKQWATQTIN